MDFLKSKTVVAWAIPSVCAVVFFGLTAFMIPYSSSLGEVKLSLAQLVLSMCAFGHADNAAHASLDFSYCLLVPPISAFLIYLRRSDLAQARIRGSSWGLAIILFGMAVYWFGLRAENQYFGYAALQILLAGLAIWLWGWDVFRVLLFPWAFFVFTWPTPFLDSIIAFPLRMIMSGMASHLLPLMGVPTVQSGTALLSAPDIANNIPIGSRFQIDIADPCSGIRSLFALTMFSALFGYLLLDKLWQQWLIFLSAFPLAILGNLARVVLLVFGSIWFGSAYAIGTDDTPSSYHENCGFFVYVVALGAEILIASLLTRNWRRPPAELPDDEPAEA